MKRWTRFVALFYPRGWREEFGDEFEAVLDDVGPGWRVIANVLKGAVKMRISEGSGWMKLVGATTVVGALVALGMSFMASQQSYRSMAMLTVVSPPDSVRPESADAQQQRAIEHVNQLREEILSRSNLSSIINDPKLLLYRKELETKPLYEVVNHMHRDLRIQLTSSATGDERPILVGISFVYPDRSKAEAAVAAVANKFVEQDHAMSREQVAAYQRFWQDMHDYAHAEPAPPPPVDDVVHVSLWNPLPSPPDRLTLVERGLLVGLLVGLVIRWPRSFLRVAGFAVVGFVLAAGVSLPFSNRFTSTAEMMISPAILTEDPHAIPPPATSAAEFLKQIEPQLLSTEELTKIIEDRRLNLYWEERQRKPMEEIVSEMRANLRIAPADAAGAVASAFHIVFTYPDRFKAQLAVEAVMTEIMEIHQGQMKADASRMSFAAHTIYERRDGQVLRVLDTANLPQQPDGLARPVIAMGGLGIGLLLGLFRLRRRSDPPPTPLLQESVALG